MDFVVPPYFQPEPDSTVMAVASSIFTAWLDHNPDSPMTIILIALF